jgi:hypothetical protein
VFSKWGGTTHRFNQPLEACEKALTDRNVRLPVLSDNLRAQLIVWEQRVRGVFSEGNPTRVYLVTKVNALPSLL